MSYAAERPETGGREPVEQGPVAEHVVADQSQRRPGHQLSTTRARQPSSPEAARQRRGMPFSRNSGPA